jgi:hypothetical protein
LTLADFEERRINETIITNSFFGFSQGIYIILLTFLASQFLKYKISIPLWNLIVLIICLGYARLVGGKDPFEKTLKENLYQVLFSFLALGSIFFWILVVIKIY